MGNGLGNGFVWDGMNRGWEMGWDGMNWYGLGHFPIGLAIGFGRDGMNWVGRKWVGLGWDEFGWEMGWVGMG